MSGSCEECFLDLGEKNILIAGPMRIRKNLNFNHPIKPCFFHPATNLGDRDTAFAHDAKDLVDGAFLRRIPYKIEVPDPSVEEFRELCGIMCKVMGFEKDDDAIEYLIKTHYLEVDRPFRLCQPRDLLLQVKNYCSFHQIPIEISRDAFDFAVDNYFSVM